MTIYRLYSQNGDRSGFWIQHRTWKNMCAKVLSIAGAESGRLPGKAPTHEEAEVLVRGYDVRSGRLVEMSSRVADTQDKNYVLIAKPSWHHESTAGV